MNTKITAALAALLLAGVSQAALAQDHEHGGDRPQVGDRGGSSGGGHWDRGGDRGGPRTLPPAPQSAPVVQPRAPEIRAPEGGHARFGAPPPTSAAPAPAPVVAPAAAPAPAPAPRGDRGGDRGDHRWGDRGPAPDRNTFAPGGTANGDRHWDRHDAPREVVPGANNGERGWDRDHDGHAADARRLDHDRNGDGRWDGRRDGDRRDWDRDHRDSDHRDWDRDHRGDHDRDHRGPPSNWRHWERGQFPPVYSSSHRYRISPYRAPYGYYVRAWAFGDFLPRGWFGPSYWLDDFYDYDLPYPPLGYHWVRVGDDVLLVDDYTGRIVQVIRDMFW